CAGRSTRRVLDPRLPPIEPRGLVTRDFLEKLGGTTQKRFGRRAGDSVHPQLHDRSAGGHAPILTKGLAIAWVGTPVKMTNLEAGARSGHQPQRAVSQRGGTSTNCASVTGQPHIEKLAHHGLL